MKQAGRIALTLVLALAFVALAMPALGRHLGNQFVRSVVAAAGLFAIYLAGSRWIERRPPPELAAGPGARELLYGIVLGAALFSTVMALLWLAGDYAPAGRGTAARVATAAVYVLLTAVIEETPRCRDRCF